MSTNKENKYKCMQEKYIERNLDRYPYTGVRTAEMKVRVRTSEEAPWLDSYFNGAQDYEQVAGITRGKVYNVVRTIGYGDCESHVVINDVGEEYALCDFFFETIK